MASSMEASCGWVSPSENPATEWNVAGGVVLERLAASAPRGGCIGVERPSAADASTAPVWEAAERRSGGGNDEAACRFGVDEGCDAPRSVRSTATSTTPRSDRVERTRSASEESVRVPRVAPKPIVVFHVEV